MKKLFLVLARAFVALACSMDGDEKNDFALAFIPIESVTMPEYVTPGSTYTITMYYRRPNSCYYVSDQPYYDIVDNVRTVAVQSYIIENADCRPIETAAPDVKTFDFRCPLTTDDHFKFRFFKGVDDSGYQEFIEVILPVQQ